MTLNQIGTLLKEIGPRVDEILTKVKELQSTSVSTGISTIIPNGSILLASYKGRAYGAVLHDGAIDMDGKTYPTVSMAARSITKHETNGWLFWLVKVPGSKEFIPVNNLRKK